mmetsp:Transcript_16466/g.29265  ORF Transcript_16466/g.29265 Transcript_16466/m.29265 type:complete len:993 (-) Transcript_16466:130-3108(-)
MNSKPWGHCLQTQRVIGKKRLDGIKRFRALLLGGASNVTNFVQLVKDYLREVFNVQLKDLRSAIAKEACYTITTMCAECQPSQWEVMSDWWLAALFKCTFVTIAVIAEASNATLRFLFGQGRLNARAVNCLIQHTQNKHNVCRTRAYEYVLLMLHTQQLAFVEKYQDGIESALVSGVTDSVGEIRLTARRVWWAYKENFAGPADRLLLRFDAQTQKQVHDERDKYEIYRQMEKENIHASPAPPAKTAACQGPKSPALARKKMSTTPNAKKTRDGPPNSVEPATQNIVPRHSETPGAGGAKRPVMHPPQSLVQTDPGLSVAAKSTCLHGASSFNAQLPNLSQVLSVNEDFTTIMEFADKSLWSDRVKFFDTIKLLLSSPRSNEVGQNLDKVLSCHIEHLMDTHHKVVTSVLRSLTDLVQLYPQAMAPRLEEMLAKVFLKQVDAKEEVRQSAQDVTEALHDFIQPTSLLIPILLKVLDAGNAKSNCACAEFFVTCLRSCQDYLSNSTIMKMAIHKLLRVSSSKQTPDLHRACTAALQSLHTLSPTVFLSQVVLLTASEMHDIQERLLPAVPDIGDHLAEHRKRVLTSPARHTPKSASSMPAAAKILDDDESQRPTPIHGESDDVATNASEARTSGSKQQPDHDLPPSLLDGLSLDQSPKHSSGLPPNRTDRSGQCPVPSTLMYAETSQACGQGLSPLIPSTHATHASGGTSGSLREYNPLQYEPGTAPRTGYSASPLHQPGPDMHWLSNLSLSGQQLPKDASLTIESLVITLNQDEDAAKKRMALQLLESFSSGSQVIPTGKFCWEADFDQLLLPVMKCVRDEDTTIQASAIFLINHLVAKYPAMCNNHIPGLIRCLVDACDSPATAVSQSADEGLLSITHHLQASTCLECIIEEIHSSTSNVQVPIRLMGKVVFKVDADLLEIRIPHFISALYEGFKHRSADVRKAVVFCLVDLHLALGPRFDDWLRPLNASQLKLIDIYVTRRRRAREGIQS